MLTAGTSSGLQSTPSCQHGLREARALAPRHSVAKEQHVHLNAGLLSPTDPDLQVSGRLVGQGGDMGHDLVMSKANSMELSEQKKTDTEHKKPGGRADIWATGFRVWAEGTGRPGFESRWRLLSAV